MKWFMSYVQVNSDGRHLFGHCVWTHSSDPESTYGHPIDRVARWNADYGKRDGFTIVLMSFQECSGNFPEEVDTLANGIGP